MCGNTGPLAPIVLGPWSPVNFSAIVVLRFQALVSKAVRGHPKLLNAAERISNALKVCALIHSDTSCSNANATDFAFLLYCPRHANLAALLLATNLRRELAPASVLQRNGGRCCYRRLVYHGTLLSVRRSQSHSLRQHKGKGGRDTGSRTSDLVGGQFLTAEKGSLPDCRYQVLRASFKRLSSVGHAMTTLSKTSIVQPCNSMISMHYGHAWSCNSSQAPCA